MSSAARILVVLATAFAAFDAAEWSHRAPIALPESPTEFARVTLTEELVDRAQPDLHDLRVTNAENAPLRHFTARETPSNAEVVWKNAALLNTTYIEGAYARVTIDFGEPQRKDRIRVEIPGTNYRRYAELEGSPDGATWETVATDWLFRIVEPTREFRSETIAFPENDFPFLRLTVHNMEDESGRVTIGGVQWADRVEPAHPETFDVPVTVTRIDPDDPNDNRVVYELDLRWKHLPVHSIAMKAEEAFFYRGVEIYGRNAKTHTVERRTDFGIETREEDAPWHRIRSDFIYRMMHEDDTRERLSFDGLAAPYRYLQLRVYNRDNQPLILDEGGFTVKRLALPAVVLETGGAETLHLYAGNPKASAPDYDLRQVLDQSTLDSLPEGSLGDLEALHEEAGAMPWAGMGEYALWGVLIVAVAVVIALIVRNLGQMKPEDD